MSKVVINSDMWNRSLLAIIFLSAVQWCWLRSRAALPCSEEASGRPRAMMNHWQRGWLAAAAAGCPASGDVPVPRGYVARQSGVVSSVFISPFLICVLPVTLFRFNVSRSKPNQGKMLTGRGEGGGRRITQIANSIVGLSNRRINSKRGLCLN